MTKSKLSQSVAQGIHLSSSTEYNNKKDEIFLSSKTKSTLSLNRLDNYIDTVAALTNYRLFKYNFANMML